jgi:hypothetical protein
MGLDRSLDKCGDAGLPCLGNGLPKGLDPLDLVQGLRGEVRGTASWATPHWDALDHEQACRLAVASRDMLAKN